MFWLDPPPMPITLFNLQKMIDELNIKMFHDLFHMIIISKVTINTPLIIPGRKVGMRLLLGRRLIATIKFQPLRLSV